MDSEALAREVAEIMGLSGSRFSTNPQVQREQQMSQSTGGQNPTAQTEFQRGNTEGTLSPKAKPSTRGVPTAAAQQ